MRIEARIALGIGGKDWLAAFEHAFDRRLRRAHLIGIKRLFIEAVQRRERKLARFLIGDHHEAAVRVHHIDGDIEDASQNDVEFKR